MLTSCSINPHGFQAKVGDFGLSRDADASARIAGNLYGTISHMAPEVMLEAQLGPVSALHDCFSTLMQVRSRQHFKACFG
jgi:serine/threonine protein kinase